MSANQLRQSLMATLESATAAYQEAHVIPHCGICQKPCCALDALVLELNWKQVKDLWRIEEARTAFDRRLSAGEGPEEIRAGNDLYYAHQKPCPAYDLTARTCRVYNQPVKPAGCSDFPVYADGDCITADLRCEAVNLDTLTEFIAKAVGPSFRITRSADRQFPFLVAIELKKRAAGASEKPQRPRRASPKKRGS